MAFTYPRNIIALLVGSFAFFITVGCDNQVQKKTVEQELRIISFALSEYAYVYMTTNNEIDLSNGESIYRILTTDSNGVKYLPANPRWDTAKRLVDPWQNDYQAELVLRTNIGGKILWRYRVWSNGPYRGTNEQNSHLLIYDPP